MTLHRPVLIDRLKNQITCYCSYQTREYPSLDQAWDEFDETDRHTKEADDGS